MPNKNIEEKEIKRAQEVFDGMMAYDLISKLNPPMEVLEALDYAANYFGDIAKGREYSPEPLKDAFPTIYATVAEQSRDEALKEAEEAVDAEMKHWRVTDGGLVFMSGLIRAYNAIRSLSTNKE